MQFKITKKSLLSELQKMKDVVNVKPSMLVLAKVKIDADKQSNTLTLTTTDLNVTCVLQVTSGLIFLEGSILVNYKDLCQVLTKMPNIDINFRLDGDTLHMQGNGSQSYLNIVDSLLYPELPDYTEPDSTDVIKESDLKSLVANTVPFVSTNIKVPICNGVYVKSEFDKLTFASTDTKRIGEGVAQIERTPHTDSEVYEAVIPSRALACVAKCLTGNGYSKSLISFKHNKLIFVVGKAVILANMFEGKFPNYTAGFRYDPVHSLFVNREKLISTLEFVRTKCEDEDKLVTINIGEKLIIENLVTANNRTIGEISGFKHDGEPIKFCFNSTLLISLLKVMTTDNVILGYRSNVEPVWVKETHKTNGIDKRHVIMPMRIIKEDKGE